MAFVAQQVLPGDFYKPSHVNIFVALSELHATGGQIDALTVVDALRRLGLPLVPASLLVGFQTAVGAISHVRRYAEIVQSHAYRRSALKITTEATKRLVEFKGDPDPVVVVEEVQARLVEIDSPLTVGSPGDLSGAEFLAENIEATAPWVIPGLLRVDERCMMVGVEGGGRALAVDTPILTANGWSTMGALTPGVQVFDETGAACSVVAVTEEMDSRPCYRVRFSDGTEIVADGEHQWRVLPYDQRRRDRWRPQIVTTADMADSLLARDGLVKNYAVEVCGALKYHQAVLPIDPYVLGVWLGDGHARSAHITSPDEDIPNLVRACGYTVEKVAGNMLYNLRNSARQEKARAMALVYMQSGVSEREAERLSGCTRGAASTLIAAAGLKHAPKGKGHRHSRNGHTIAKVVSVQASLREMDLLQNKHIPSAYLQAAVSQRLALLQGLMDTDGYIGPEGNGSGRGFGAAKCEFVSTLPRLASDVMELVTGLGIKAVMRTAPSRRSDGTKTGATKYRIHFQTDKPVFRMDRKAVRVTPLRTRRARFRYVASVEPVTSVPVRCIQVDSATGCFLASRSLIPTHNSILLRQLAVATAYGLHPFTIAPFTIEPVNTLLIDLENPRRITWDWTDRISRVSRFITGNETGGDRWRIWLKPAGIDLAKRRDRIQLEDILKRHRPKVVCIGPLYKAHGPSEGRNYEDVARGLQDVFDDLRIRYGFALIIEHHAPGGTKEGRQMRPEGSSLWMRWGEMRWKLLPVKPEPPYKTLLDQFPVKAMRRDQFSGDRDPHAWPDAFYWGNSRQLPWQGWWNEASTAPAQTQEELI